MITDSYYRFWMVAVKLYETTFKPFFSEEYFFSTSMQVRDQVGK